MSANEGGGNEGSSGNGCRDNGRGNELAMQKVLKVSVSINFDANTVHIQRAIQIKAARKWGGNARNPQSVRRNKLRCETQTETYYRLWRK